MSEHFLHLKVEQEGGSVGCEHLGTAVVLMSESASGFYQLQISKLLALIS